jgi:hypothetical protein
VVTKAAKLALAIAVVKLSVYEPVPLSVMLDTLPASLIATVPVPLKFTHAVAVNFSTPFVSCIVFTFNVLIYTTVHVDPTGIVTVAAVSIVIGPADIAFVPDVIV